MSTDYTKAGWDYCIETLSDASPFVEANWGEFQAEEYLIPVKEAIKQFTEDLEKLGENNLGVKQLKGFVAEYWQADTFNIDAAVKESTSRAFRDGSTGNASVDVSTNFGEGR